MTATLYIVLLFKSRRFVEYSPPVAVLLCAIILRAWLKRLDVRSLAWTELKIGGLVVASVVFVAAVWGTVQAARRDVSALPSSEAYKGGAEWLARNTSQGARVFHTGWDDFLGLFFFNTHNTCIVGLDPDFLRCKTPHRHQRWKAITRGRVRLPAKVIFQKFGCEYAFTDNAHRTFIALADRDPFMKKIYADRQTTVYRVLDDLMGNPRPKNTRERSRRAE